MTDETRQKITKILEKELSLRRFIPPRRIGQSFRSFSEFKRTIGSAGTGYAWHHIVGQTTSNLQRFGAPAIHNTGNLVRLEHGKDTIHQEITNFYNSIQPTLTGSNKLLRSLIV